jgi:hypothetical protein
MTFCAPRQGIFAGMTQAQLQAALVAAQSALIQLQTGGLGVSFAYTQGDGSKSVTKKVGSVAEITALILQLQQALGMGRARRPIRYTFR